jgi:CheY-like chemotaxis protein
VTESPRPSGRSRETVIIRCFPRADRAFQQAVERIVQADPQLDARDHGAADRLERRIRERFPGAAVRPQDPLATFGMEAPVWYVYRRDAPMGASDDVTPEASGGAQELPEDAAVHSAVERSVGPGGRPVYSAAAAASMVGVPLSVIVEWTTRDGLVQAHATHDGQQLFSRDDMEDLLFIKKETIAGRIVDEVRPRLEARRRRRASGGRESTGSRRLLVLLAERDPYAAEYTEYFLRTEGYDVEVTFDSTEAQAAGVALGPDLAVVELLISGGAGTELCARLKAGGVAHVLAISTLDDEDAALRAGADAFLSKPLDPLQFVSTVRDLLGESAMLRARRPS